MSNAHLQPGAPIVTANAVAEESRRLGFVAAVLTPAVPLTGPAPQRHAQWIADGHQADMSHLATSAPLRHDPGHPGLLAGTTAVLVAALPYGAGAAVGGLWSRIAAHARGRDYHLTLKERLAALADRLFPGMPRRICVDSAPLSERSLALAAGLGELGRHGGLIIPGVGARVLLGEVLLAGAVAPSRPRPRPAFLGCGDCIRCLEACPTHAIVAPGIVDARRCLSYQSIESAASIPPDLAGKMTFVFGCDVCTAVCPRELPTPSALEPARLSRLADFTLAEAALQGAKEWRRNLRGTALFHTGVRRLKRNLAAVLANRSASLPDTDGRPTSG